MYQLLCKPTNKKRYKAIRKSKFKNYYYAYSYLGNMLQKKDTLHWGYSTNYMNDGYSKKKLIVYGKTFFRRKNYHFKIVEC